MPSRLLVHPGKMQVSSTGGTTKHKLVNDGDERLAFKVKLKPRYFKYYSVSPVVGFIKPGESRTMEFSRQPGKVGHDSLIIQYIVAPSGYDPRQPFVLGAKIGKLKVKLTAVKGKPAILPDIPAKGKYVTAIGQNWQQKEDKERDLKIEAEVAKQFAQPFKFRAMQQAEEDKNNHEKMTNLEKKLEEMNKKYGKLEELKKKLEEVQKSNKKEAAKAGNAKEKGSRSKSRTPKTAKAKTCSQQSTQKSKSGSNDQVEAKIRRQMEELERLHELDANTVLEELEKTQEGKLLIQNAARTAMPLPPTGTGSAAHPQFGTTTAIPLPPTGTSPAARPQFGTATAIPLPPTGTSPAARPQFGTATAIPLPPTGTSPAPQPAPTANSASKQSPALPSPAPQQSQAGKEQLEFDTKFREAVLAALCKKDEPQAMNIQVHLNVEDLLKAVKDGKTTKDGDLDLLVSTDKKGRNKVKVKGDKHKTENAQSGMDTIPTEESSDDDENEDDDEKTPATKKASKSTSHAKKGGKNEKKKGKKSASCGGKKSSKSSEPEPQKQPSSNVLSDTGAGEELYKDVGYVPIVEQSFDCGRFAGSGVAEEYAFASSGNQNESKKNNGNQSNGNNGYQSNGNNGYQSNGNNGNQGSTGGNYQQQTSSSGGGKGNNSLYL